MMKLFFLIFLASSLLFGDVKTPDEIPVTPQPQAPWLTGPLIAPNELAVPYGQIQVQTYLYFTTYTGTYNSDFRPKSDGHNFFSLNPQFLFYFGLTPWMDINIVPQFFYNTTRNQNSVQFGDLPIGLDFQLLDPSVFRYFPGIKLSVKETFPTGPYKKLNPHKLLTDQTGSGAYSTNFNLLFYKVYNVFTSHFLSTIYSAAYTVNSPVQVSGFNVYGGGYHAKGTVLPGNTFQGIISFEFTLNQNFVLALDNVYTHVNRSKFFGNPGITTASVLASNTVPSSEQLSFAPAIEYNFSANFGIIAGCWLTAWGRNSPLFRSGVIEFDLSF